MNEPLSKVLGLQRKYTENDLGHTYNEGKRAGHNNVLDELDQLSPDVNKLAEIITEVKQHELYDLNLSSQYLAKQIVNSIPQWIKKAN